MYGQIDTAVEALRALASYGDHLATTAEKSDFRLDAETNASEAVADAVDAGRTSLSEYETKTILAAQGCPVTPFELATSAAEAVEVAAGFDGPVAMKVASPDVVHKTEAGGVELGVEDDDAVRAAFERITTSVGAYDADARIDGVLLSPMVDDGVELLVGVVDDPEIGPVITCGVGGILVEAVDDVAFRALPLTPYDAREMLGEIEAQALLAGPRDLPAVDRDELVALLCDVSELVEENPAIEELDINPVVATDAGLRVLDASLRLAVE